MGTPSSATCSKPPLRAMPKPWSRPFRREALCGHETEEEYSQNGRKKAIDPGQETRNIRCHVRADDLYRSQRRTPHGCCDRRDYAGLALVAGNSLRGGKHASLVTRTP